jgi:hypothetical protein
VEPVAHTELLASASLELVQRHAGQRSTTQWDT